MEINMNNFKDRVKKVNEVLQQGEKNENYTADHKGYTGYKPQYIIDAVNTEFSGEWDLEIIKMETYPVTNKSGDKKPHAFVSVRLTLNGKKIDSVASHPILDDVGDAFKSAQTDAMKKAFAHFSIGNRAYHGLLKITK